MAEVVEGAVKGARGAVSAVRQATAPQDGAKDDADDDGGDGPKRNDD